ncbi:hypothetical protein QFC20_000029 [Naganishia adeliensis]|uniref:Uncharacterized protein n=1 Tax=Naganishia adeliensis TaxID=92952 RepID=A0ACC2X2Y4_9TREE|nr:hypothetical protein QFC20_000029 [Naganishia adeliensis]
MSSLSLYIPHPILHLLHLFNPSRFITNITSHFQSLILRILRAGPIPRHVAFVMDGNRRFARERGWVVRRGHEEGFESLKSTLSLCVGLRIRYITVYAFSIDNFARPKDEVEGLLELTRGRLRRLCEAGDYMQSHDIKVTFLGRREMLPPDVLDAVESMERDTSTHQSAVLNVCCPYTSRDEITTAVKRTMEEVESSAISISILLYELGSSFAGRDITPRLIESHLATNDPRSLLARDLVPLDDEKESFQEKESSCEKKPHHPRVVAPPLDILVRTSDVHRLSDFLMWQTSSGTQLHFVKALWPQFGLREMVRVLLAWQRGVLTRRLRD